jgi:hypothetical protein
MSVFGLKKSRKCALLLSREFIEHTKTRAAQVPVKAAVFQKVFPVRPLKVELGRQAEGF